MKCGSPLPVVYTQLYPYPKVEIIQDFSSYLWYSDRDFLYHEYVENKKSVKQIAREIGSSHSTILKYLAHFDIPIREEALPHYKKGQLAFGRRAIKGAELTNNRELEIIAKMKELRANGFSYWKIADILNTMAIPTKNKKSRWHPTTVMKILKAADQSLDFPTHTSEVCNLI